jgi:hypothetical protein
MRIFSSVFVNNVSNRPITDAQATELISKTNSALNFAKHISKNQVKIYDNEVENLI